MAVDLSAVFTYPYDNDLLMRKQKSLRRQLLAREGIQYIDKRIAILGGSTTDDIKNLLEIFLLEAGIRPEFYQSEYNKFYEDAVFSNAELEEFKPEIIVVFTSVVNLMYQPAIGDSEEAVKSKLQQDVGRFQQVWDSLASKYNAVIIQNNMDMPYVEPLGSLGAVIPQGITSYVSKVNEVFAAYAAAHPNFYLHDLNSLSASIGTGRWHNRFQYYAYKFAMNYDVFPDVANGLAKIVKGILGKSKKCLVLDLDNTLWGGVIGDDGVNGIAIGHETPTAEAYTEFQQYVKKLKDWGIILAVCSKNEDDIARTGFDHPDSVLKVDDFVSFKANWQPKNLNIQEIAKEINIGTDSLVFIDDNPAERQLVRDTMPEVAVPEVNPQDVFSYIRVLEGAGYFQPASISQDDLKRSSAYMENKQRMELQNSAVSYDDFLKSLNMQAEVAPFKEVYFDRIAQLTNKSNQFNLTTKRYTLADIKAIAADDKYITRYGRLEDKFGDNGLISLVIGEKKNDELHLILWLMSCRVLKRGMENTMLDEMVAAAQQAGIKKLVGYYYPTKKNRMVANLYKDFGFTLVQESDEGTVWELSADGYEKQNKFIEVMA